MDGFEWPWLTAAAFPHLFVFLSVSFGPTPIGIRAGKRVHKPSLGSPQTEGTARDRPMRTR